VAFGGRIFTLLPELNQKVPGYFLGEKLLESVSKIEEMMMNPLPPRESQTEQNQFDETIATFLDKKNLISYQTLHNLDEIFEGHIPARSIREANEFLAQDILAALSLGDIYLLGTNIDWVQSLLAHREFPQDLLVAYLEAYLAAAKANLDETGRPILEWLGSVLTNQP
jgi:hypothetical protein